MQQHVISALKRRTRWTGQFTVLVLLIILTACGSDTTPSNPSPDNSSSENASATPDTTLGTTLNATVEVDRAGVFGQPNRLTEPVTYLYQREQVAIQGQSADGTWLLTTVDGQQGWILRAQVSLNGDPVQIEVISTPTPIPPTVTPLPALTDTPQPTLPPTSSPTLPPTAAATAQPSSDASPETRPSPTKTLIPTPNGFESSEDAPPTPSVEAPVASTQEPVPDSTSLPDVSPTSAPTIRLGEPPPLTITTPDGWQSGHILLPFRTAITIRDVPLSIYEGPLPGNVTGHIYLFWGFPNVASPTGELNLWADGLQLLRGAIIDSSCNLGIDTQETFYVGGREATGTFYTAIDCEGETDTAGWFAVLQVGGGNYAFFTAVEPLNALPEQLDNLQAILNTVVFDNSPSP